LGGLEVEASGCFFVHTRLMHVVAVALVIPWGRRKIGLRTERREEKWSSRKQPDVANDIQS
jgi:hypothetical protein